MVLTFSHYFQLKGIAAIKNERNMQEKAIYDEIHLGTSNKFRNRMDRSSYYSTQLKEEITKQNKSIPSKKPLVTSEHKLA